MVRLADWVKNNREDVDRLTKAGILSTTLKKNFDIYQHFTTNNDIPSRMQRYTATAEAMRVSEGTVRKAVRVMKRKI